MGNFKADGLKSGPPMIRPFKVVLEKSQTLKRLGPPPTSSCPEREWTQTPDEDVWSGCGPLPGPVPRTPRPHLQPCHREATHSTLSYDGA